MKTKSPIKYIDASYGLIAIIPAGTKVEQATNLPSMLDFWATPWRGMSERAKSWQRNYGFLIKAEEVKWPSQ